jgi:DNA-binding NarL/FixJ family response regulator
MSTPDDVSVSVVIVDDHRAFLDGLARILADEPDIDVLGVATDSASARSLIEQVAPKVALIDYQMPDQDGVSLAAEIKARHPDTVIVMLTGTADDRVLLAAIEAGCSGFLTKDRASAEIVNAVRAVAAGEALISPAMLARLLPKLSRTHRAIGSDLTDREREVLVELSRGSTNKVIAESLFLSVNTVRNYVQSVLMKLGAHSKLEAVATAVRQGIIDYPTGT